MTPELYLYTQIYDFVAESLISKIDECKGQDITIRLNTPGGNVMAGWGIIAKMKEHDGNVHMKVDGCVMSMGTFILAYAGSSEALDVSKIMLHRADMYISTPEQQAFLDGINKDLKVKFEKKIDKAKLKELKGVTLEQIFASEEQMNVWLTAKEAKSIGLIDKVTSLNPSEAKAFNEKMFSVAAVATEKPKPIIKPNSIMDIAQLKADHRAVYDEIFALGVTQGVAKEKDRVEACLVFQDIDPAGVKAAIESGNPLSAKAMSEFTLKVVSAKKVEGIELDAAGKPIVTAEVTAEAQKTEKEKAIAAFEAAAKANLNIK